jgi:hypothetical protein
MSLLPSICLEKLRKTSHKLRRLVTVGAQSEIVTRSLPHTIIDHCSFTNFLVDIFRLVKFMFPEICRFL